MSGDRGGGANCGDKNANRATVRLYNITGLSSCRYQKLKSQVEHRVGRCYRVADAEKRREYMMGGKDCRRLEFRDRCEQ